MSTYFATYPQNVPFPQFSQALQASVYWEPSLSVSISVLNATSPAIVALRADSVALNEALRAEYEAMRDFFIETLDKFKGTDPDIDDYIARIYTTFLEQPVDTDVYGEPKSWETFNFGAIRPDLILDDVDWFKPLSDSQRENFMPSASGVARTSSNYFYGLASAYNTALRRVISERRLDWDLWREVPKLEEMYASIELLRDQMQVRNSLRGENSTEIRRLQEAMRIELNTALLALVTARFDSDLVWSTPIGRHTNHMAQVETTITNPARADEIASQVELEVDNNSLNILTTLQEDFPDYDIPLEVQTRAYNQTGMVSNLNVSRNGRSDDYPVRDARTGSYLWVQGGPNFTGLKRYGANSPAVDSMVDFMAYTFPQVRLVSEHDVDYSLSGRTDLGEFLEYYNRYETINSAINGDAQILPFVLTPEEQSFMVNGEFDFEAARDSLREEYGYWGDISSIVEHQYIMSNLDGSVVRVPIEEVFQGVNDYDDMVEEYGSAIPVAVEFESETFKTQQSESYRMDDASRPFFDPESEGPYELSGSPSGSEVSYGAEIMSKEGRKPKSAYIRGDFDRFGLSHPVITFYDFIPRGVADGEITIDPNASTFRPNQPHQIHRSTGLTEEDINELISAYNDWYDADNSPRPGDRMPYPWDGDYYDYNTLYSMRLMTNPNQVARNYYRDDLEESLSAEDKRNCGCGQDPCVTYGAEPEMRRRVRTISGKPHTPRKLVKDQDITPEEAAKRVKLEAEGQDMYYTREEAMARARELGCHDVHTHEMDGRTVYMPCYTHAKYEEMREMMAEDKREETVVDSKEESGITTETRQYKRKKYNPEKMKQDIPSKILNQTDSDDIWVALAAGILGIGIGASIERMGIIERFTRRSD